MYNAKRNNKPQAPKYISSLLRNKDFIHNAAEYGMRKAMYALEQVGELDDWGFAESKRVTKGFYRVHMDDSDMSLAPIDERTDYMFEERGTAYGCVEKLDTPEQYEDDFSAVSFEGFEGRLRNGRVVEVIVKTLLDRAGVTNYLLPCIFDRDYSKVDIDIILERPVLNSYGSFERRGFDVKYHTHEFFTNNYLYDEFLRVDFVHAHDRKLRAASQKGIPYIGTIHYSATGGGLLYLPNNSQDQWTKRVNRSDGKVREEWIAPAECFYPIAALVQRYTHNTPELRAARKAQEEEISRGF